MSIANYLRDTQGELRQVKWPTRRQTTIFTIVVIAFSIILSLLLGAFDVLFNYLLKLVV